MKYLFTEGAKQILGALTFTHSLFAFDFDGTLAPIVTDPDRAGLQNGLKDLMRSLSQRAPVAVISGRSVDDVKKRLGFEPSYLIGNHGVEGLNFKRAAANKAQHLCKEWSLQLNRGWSRLSDPTGVFIEDKAYSIALHYRRSRTQRTTRSELLSLVSDLKPSPRIVLGKRVINLVPTGAPHKGVALLEIMLKAGTNCALYIGDDDTDEDVFSLPDSRIITIRVGEKRSSQAQYFIRRQTEVTRLVREIIKAFETQGDR